MGNCRRKDLQDMTEDEVELFLDHYLSQFDFTDINISTFVGLRTMYKHMWE